MFVEISLPHNAKRGHPLGMDEAKEMDSHGILENCMIDTLQIDLAQPSLRMLIMRSHGVSNALIYTPGIDDTLVRM